MKKDYIKPYLAVESFQLDAAVAGSCTDKGGVAINKNKHDCVEAFDLFFGAACAEVPGGTDVTDVNYENDGLCYHGPVYDLADAFLSS